MWRSKWSSARSTSSSSSAASSATGWWCLWSPATRPCTRSPTFSSPAWRSMTSLSVPSPCRSHRSTPSSRAGTLARSCATSSRWSRPLRSTFPRWRWRPSRWSGSVWFVFRTCRNWPRNRPVLSSCQFGSCRCPSARRTPSLWSTISPQPMGGVRGVTRTGRTTREGPSARCRWLCSTASRWWSSRSAMCRCGWSSVRRRWRVSWSFNLFR